MKLQWIPRNVSDGMPESVPAYIYTYTDFLVKLEKCENICILKNKCILKDTETKDTGSGYLSSVFLFLPAYHGSNSPVYIKRVWKKHTRFSNNEALTNSLKTHIPVGDDTKIRANAEGKGADLRSHPLYVLLDSHNSYQAACVRTSKFMYNCRTATAVLLSFQVRVAKEINSIGNYVTSVLTFTEHFLFLNLYQR